MYLFHTHEAKKLIGLLVIYKVNLEDIVRRNPDTTSCDNLSDNVSCINTLELVSCSGISKKNCFFFENVHHPSKLKNKMFDMPSENETG